MPKNKERNKENMLIKRIIKDSELKAHKTFFLSFSDIKLSIYKISLDFYLASDINEGKWTTHLLENVEKGHTLWSKSQ